MIVYMVFEFDFAFTKMTKKKMDEGVNDPNKHH